MKRKVSILFITYFPVILVACQVLVNLLWVVDTNLYYKWGFWLGLSFGANLLYAFFLVVFTFSIKFCEVSRWCAIAELLMAITYGIIQQDNVYNISIQIIIGIVAIALTFRLYIKKFPFCRLSLLTGFIGSVIASGCRCEKGLAKWEDNIRAKLINHHARNRL